MRNFKNKSENPDIFFRGDIKPLTNTGAIIINYMIEIELLQQEFFPSGYDPYEWVAEKIGKSPRTVRSWTNDWNTKSGSAPTLIDFLRLIKITGTATAHELIENLDPNETVSDKRDQYGKMLKTISDEIISMGKYIGNMSKKHLRKDSDPELKQSS